MRRSGVKALSAVDLAERRTNDLEHLGRRDAPALDEGRHDPSALHLSCDLRPCPVHDDDVVPGRAEGKRLRGRHSRNTSTELAHNPAHVVYSALIRT